MKILYFSPTPLGGIAEYSVHQVRALKDLGADVVCLVAPGFLHGKHPGVRTEHCLLPPPSTSPGLLRKLRLAWGIVANRYILAWRVVRHRPDLVLLDSYSEYLSPIWIDPHILLARILGFRYAANLHDPVRSHRIGPRWWHRLSVWLAYEPLSFVLVHQLPQDAVGIPRRVKVIEVPHGPYEFQPPRKTRDEVRASWNIPSDAPVFLSFGFVRDGKNIDLAIEALAEAPDAFLIVMGNVASSSDRSFDWYQEHARRFGVLERCRFFEGFVREDEIGGAFEASDYVLLTYSRDFHSQSGVLNMAVHAHKPVLASGAPSPMLESVSKYGLGVIVEPGSAQAIKEGMRILLGGIPEPRWKACVAEGSWHINASRILQAAGLRSSSAS